MFATCQTYLLNKLTDASAVGLSSASAGWIPATQRSVAAINPVTINVTCKLVDLIKLFFIQNTPDYFGKLSGNYRLINIC